jgi:ABC-type uncharacterized transport system permease subunit
MLALQTAWIIVLLIGSRLLWRRGLARYEAWGG